MSEAILYSFRRCPYAIRARIALAVSGLNPEIREVVLKDKPPEMLAIAPKKRVPVLLRPDGVVLDESLDIMSWCLDRNDPQNWLRGAEDKGLRESLEVNDGPFKMALDAYKYADPKTAAVARAEARAEGLAFLLPLNERLRNTPFLAGEAPGFFDAALFPFVRQFAGVDATWFGTLEHHGLVRWWQAMLAHPVFVRIMRRLPQWRQGQKPLYFQDSLLDAAPDA